MNERHKRITYGSVIGAVLVLAVSIFYLGMGPNDSFALGAGNAQIAQLEKTPENSSPSIKMIPQNFSTLAAAVSPAVVNIRTEKTVTMGGAPNMFPNHPSGRNDAFREHFERFFGGQQPPAHKQRSLGTGFIIDPKGYIVTNNHVIEGADKIKVALKDRDEELDAEIVGRDPHTDIALIKVKTAMELPMVKLGNSSDLKVGQWVVAIGNPFGLEHTVTAGIVSAKGRVIGSGPYDDYIQTDTSINPGNSGGPLINMNGEVVGINTMIVAGGQGIGFAIPVDLARGIVKQLADSGEVSRGWMGVTIQDLKGELAGYYGMDDKKGVLVASVVPGDPADNAGIKPRDVIVAINDETVTGSRDLTRLVAGLGVGDNAEVTVLRDGLEKTLTVTIAKRSDHLADAGQGSTADERESNYGLQVTDITPEMAKRHNLSTDEGVMVAGVIPGGKADQAGMERGDIILEIDRKAVKSARDLKGKLEKTPENKSVALLVQRPNAGMMIFNLS